MPSPFLLRASNVMPFVSVLDDIGTPVDKLLKKNNLSRNIISDPLAICTESQIWNFIDQCSRLERINTLGILTAERNTIESLGLFGQQLMNSFTLQECLITFIEFISKHHSDGKRRFWMETKGEQTYFCATDPYELKVAGAFQAVGYTLIFMLKTLQAYLGCEWKPDYIYIQDSQKHIWENCELLSDLDLFFEQKYYAIAFPSYLLTATRQFKKRLAYSSSDPSIVKNWLSFESPESYSESIRVLLESLLIHEQINKLDQIAEIMGKSKRTINRYLEQEGTTYKDILKNVRYKIAIEKLTQTSVAIAEIAYDLGYSDQAHFSNAFKQWSGYSPFLFRQQNRSIAAYFD